MRRILSFSCLLAVCLLRPCAPLSAQDMTVGINVAELLDFGTLNVSAGYALSRHFSLEATLRINPWTFGHIDESKDYKGIVRDAKSIVFSKKESFSVGVRYWPWYFLTEGWLSVQGLVCGYDRGGWLLGKQRRNGTFFGLSIGAGWCFLLSPEFSLDIGVRGFAGMISEYLYEDIFLVRNATQVGGFACGLDELVVSIAYCF